MIFTPKRYSIQNLPAGGYVVRNWSAPDQPNGKPETWTTIFASEELVSCFDFIERQFEPAANPFAPSKTLSAEVERARQNKEPVPGVYSPDQKSSHSHIQEILDAMAKVWPPGKMIYTHNAKLDPSQYYPWQK